MLIIAAFTEEGSPKTGLSPTVNVRDASDGSLVLVGNMSEIGDGGYKYDFSTAEAGKDYFYKADAGASISGPERYAFGSNENSAIKTDTDNLVKVQKNKWEIDPTAKTWTVYEDDGTTVLYSFNLFNESGNPDASKVFKREPI